MVDHRRGAGVVEQVGELVGDVAVVDVERGGPGQRGAEGPLEVLDAVVEVQADVVLPGLPPLQLRALAVHRDALGEEVVGQPVRPLTDLGVGPAARAGHHAGPVTAGDGDVGEQRGEVQHDEISFMQAAGERSGSVP